MKCVSCKRGMTTVEHREFPIPGSVYSTIRAYVASCAHCHERVIIPADLQPAEKRAVEAFHQRQNARFHMILNPPQRRRRESQARYLARWRWFLKVIHTSPHTRRQPKGQSYAA